MPVPESVPVWLSKLGDPLGPIPMPDVLRHCVYYPAAGLDGDPVKYLGRYFQSFVYVDYGVGEQRVLNDLPNFRGYDQISNRQVCQDELVPQGWQPRKSRREHGTPKRNASFMPSKPPFAIWAVYDRKPEVCPEHGPKRFSLLYIGGDGAETFHALFYSHQVSPAVVALIQPGRDFSDPIFFEIGESDDVFEYIGIPTDFDNPNHVFARLVRENPAGQPSHLLYGGWGDGESYRDAPWPEYRTAGLILHGRLRLFARQLAPVDVDEVDDLRFR